MIANLPLHLGHPDPLWPGNKVWGQQLECFTLVGYSITHQLSGRLLPIFTLASKRFKKHTKADRYFLSSPGQSNLGPRSDAATSSSHNHTSQHISVFQHMLMIITIFHHSPCHTRFGCGTVQGPVSCSIAVRSCPSFTKKIVKLWQSAWTKARRDKKLKWQKCCCWDDSS